MREKFSLQMIPAKKWKRKDRTSPFSSSKELIRVIGEYWCVLQERRPDMCYAMKEHNAHARDRTQMLRKLPQRHEDLGLIPIQQPTRHPAPVTQHWGGRDRHDTGARPNFWGPRKELHHLVIFLYPVYFLLWALPFSYDAFSRTFTSLYQMGHLCRLTVFSRPSRDIIVGEWEECKSLRTGRNAVRRLPWKDEDGGLICTKFMFVNFSTAVTCVRSSQIKVSHRWTDDIQGLPLACPSPAPCLPLACPSLRSFWPMIVAGGGRITVLWGCGHW